LVRSLATLSLFFFLLHTHTNFSTTLLPLLPFLTSHTPTALAAPSVDISACLTLPPASSPLAASTMPPNAAYYNSIFALCDGVTTTLASQPYRPSGSVLRARRRTLFGAQLPTSPAGNPFVDLYSQDGTRITFRSTADLRRVAGNPVGLHLDFPGEISYPQTVELTVPWLIGAPGQQRDYHFAFALLTQLMSTPSTSSLHPGPNELRACAFTRLCRRQTPEYDTAFAADRAIREICTTPIFQSPKVFMIPVKQEQQLVDGRVLQAWFPWQVCTNCLAGRAKGRCSHFFQALQVQQPMRTFVLRPGEQSEFDVYAWFTDNRNGFLAKDLGFYDLWMCRDGVERTMADV
ncbi:hypothetical protein DM02DRAFT_710307, partial [Periconia macrospinosa]